MAQERLTHFERLKLTDTFDRLNIKSLFYTELRSHGVYHLIRRDDETGELFEEDIACE